MKLKQWHLAPDQNTDPDKVPFPGAQRCQKCWKWMIPVFQSAKIQWCPSCEKEK